MPGALRSPKETSYEGGVYKLGGMPPSQLNMPAHGCVGFGESTQVPFACTFVDLPNGVPGVAGPPGRSGDAYADATMDEARERSRRVFPHAATEIGSQMGGAALFASLGRQTFVTVLAAVMPLHC